MGRLRLVAVAVLLAGCLASPTTAGGPGRAGPTPASGGPGALSGRLTVLAAASLADALPRIAEQLTASHPDLELTFSFAGSQQLAAQIVAGAPADVVATAGTSQLQVVADAGLVDGEVVTFATNGLAIAVEPGNPRGVTGLGDLAGGDLAVVLAADQVPAGRAAREVLDAAGVDVEPVSLETDVRGVLAKVALGEADAGLVYASDVVAAGDDVAAVEVPDDVDVVVRYPAAVVAGAGDADAARAFVDHLRSAEARSVLTAFGFGLP